MPDAHELLLDDPALGVGAVEDRARRPSAWPPSCRCDDLVGDPLGLVALVVGVVAHDRLAVALASVHSSLGLRPRLLAMTALAASRMVWVER